MTGPARILQDPAEAARLRPGDILLCAALNSAWTPLIAIVAGIITETGGALSSPAIAAREFGIPAVFAVKDATTLLQDGQIVSIDGARGVASAATHRQDVVNGDTRSYP